MDRKEYNKKYYEDNKSKILKQMSEILECEYCNKSVSKQHMNRHQRTKYCQLSRNKKENDKVEILSQKITDLENKLNNFNINQIELKDQELHQI
jgi:hypothetical protein